MLTDIQALVFSSGLTWLMVIVASLSRTKGWTMPGLVIAFGNRDDLPEHTPVSARADRAAKNMLENLVLFIALIAAARFAAAPPESLVLGATIFFWARVVYFFLYLGGIKFLRTASWAVSLVGMAMIGAAALR